MNVFGVQGLGARVRRVDLLNKSHIAQQNLLTWIHRGGIQVQNISHEVLDDIIILMEKYQNVPMDFADGSLMALAGRLEMLNIITLDSDFFIYRTLSEQLLIHQLADIISPK